MSGSKVPPAFEKKPNCQKCNGSFGFLTRQHHCRNCGKSFCEKCSSKQLPIPQFGFVEPVRVCDPCFTSIQQSSRTPAKAAPKAESASASPSAATAPAAAGAGAAVSSPAAREQAARAAGAPTTKPRSDSADEAIRDHDDPPVVAVVPTKKVSNCTCGLPFCICPPDKVVEAPKEERKVDSRPKPVAAPAKRVETAPASSSFVGLGRRAPTVTYDLKGDLNEQTRDAIKAGDVAGVQTLLNARAEARFIDRTGNSLVHLAAMFNQLDVVTMLVRSGANIWEKNPAGETPVDLAPPSLANKMKELQPTAGAAPATTA